LQDIPGARVNKDNSVCRNGFPNKLCLLDGESQSILLEVEAARLAFIRGEDIDTQNLRRFCLLVFILHHRSEATLKLDWGHCGWKRNGSQWLMFTAPTLWHPEEEVTDDHIAEGQPMEQQHLIIPGSEEEVLGEIPREWAHNLQYCLGLLVGDLALGEHILSGCLNVASFT
jgi:hypothetical protein